MIKDNRIAFFDRTDVIAIPTFSYSGRGFLPDFYSEHGFATLPEACTSVLEGGFVPGREGMMAPGKQNKTIQPGLRKGQEGVGGAGSMITSSAYGAKG